MRRAFFGVWLSWLLSVAAFGQSVPTTFLLHDALRDGTYVELPRKLRCRAIWWQPVSMVAQTPTHAAPSRAVKFVPAGPPITDEAMAMSAWPVFRGEVIESDRAKVSLYAYENNGAGNTASIRVHLGVYNGLLSMHAQTSFTDINPSSSPSSGYWFCQQWAGSGVAHGDCGDLPHWCTETEVGWRWEKTAWNEVTVYGNGHTRQMWNLSTVGGISSYSISFDDNDDDEEFPYVVFRLEEDPGTVGGGGMSEECCEEIVAAVEDVREAVETLTVVASAINTKLTGMDTKLGSIDTRLGTMNNRLTQIYTSLTFIQENTQTLVAKVTGILDAVTPPAGTVVAPEHELADVPTNPPSDFWEADIKSHLDGHGIEGPTVGGTDSSEPPVWSFVIPMNTISAAMGGPALSAINVSADFSPLAPYRLIIHAFLYAMVGLWASAYLWEELRRY